MRTLLRGCVRATCSSQITLGGPVIIGTSFSISTIERKRVFVQVCCLDHLSVYLFFLMGELWKSSWLFLDAIWGAGDLVQSRDGCIRWGGHTPRGGLGFFLPIGLNGVFYCMFTTELYSTLCEKLMFPYGQYMNRIVIYKMYFVTRLKLASMRILLKCNWFHEDITPHAVGPWG